MLIGVPKEIKRHEYRLWRLGMFSSSKFAFFATLIFSQMVLAEVTLVSYFGGTGNDEVLSAVFAEDGSIILGGTSTSPTLAGIAGTQLAPGDGFVAKLDKTGSTLLWLVRLDPVKQVQAGPGGQVYALTTRALSVVGADGSALARTGIDLGAETVAMDVTLDGRAAVLTKTKAFFFEPNGSERWNVTVGRSHLLAIALDPMSSEVSVGGDQNTNTGFEPYRSPFLYRYLGATGERTAILWNYPGSAVRADGKNLQADSFISFLKYSSSGRLWMGAGSDGGNTILTKKADDLDANQPALAGTCFAGPCFGYKGAKKTGMFALMNTERTDMERASWVIPYLGLNPAGRIDPPCGCKGGNFQGTGVNPGSFSVSALIPFEAGVIVLGNPWGKASTTPNGWFYNTVYGGGGIGWMGVFTQDLTQITKASMIPGTRSAHGDYHQGRILVAGKAADFSAANLDPAEAKWDVSLPASATALQKNFGGGTSDGYFVLACPGNCGDILSTRKLRNDDEWRMAPVVSAQGLRLGWVPAGGTYTLTSLTGAVIAGGRVPSDGLLTFPTQALGIQILKVTAAGESRIWRVAGLP